MITVARQTVDPARVRTVGKAQWTPVSVSDSGVFGTSFWSGIYEDYVRRLSQVLSKGGEECLIGASTQPN